MRKLLAWGYVLALPPAAEVQARLAFCARLALAFTLTFAFALLPARAAPASPRAVRAVPRYRATPSRTLAAWTGPARMRVGSTCQAAWSAGPTLALPRSTGLSSGRMGP